MYHLIFHSKKHQPSGYYYRQPKVNRSSTHNQFELDTIRSAIKSRWTLTGWGKTEFQTALWDMEEKLNMTAPPGHLRTHMNGHIITVENSADVIWFRLNHENVSKNKCKLHAIYRDLDVDFILRQHQTFKTIYDRCQHRYNLNSYMNQAMYQLDRFISHDVTKGTPEISLSSVKAVAELKQVQKDNGALHLQDQEAYTKLAKETFEYLKTKQTNVG